MPLTQFTITDRNVIVTSLMLDPAQLEDDSTLYQKLEGIESQDTRYPGLNRVQVIKRLLGAVRGLNQQLQELEFEPSTTFANAGIKRYTLDRVYTVEYADGATAGEYGAIKTALDQKLAELQAYLGLPWDEEEFVLPILWV